MFSLQKIKSNSGEGSYLELQCQCRVAGTYGFNEQTKRCKGNVYTQLHKNMNSTGMF